MFRALQRAVILAALPATAIAGQAPFTNWGYWLSNVEPAVIHTSEYDLVVTDFSADGHREFTREEVHEMQSRPGGGRRTVLAYLSVGEAEEYRYYWQKRWSAHPPAWLAEENPDWPGNYKVRYWMPEWQAVIFGRPEAYLDKIIAAGFDGVYLDIIDAFEYFEGTRENAMGEMIEFIVALASYARSKNPDFLIVPQNGERVLADSRLLQHIDGAAKEDLYYGLEADSTPAPDHEIRYSLQFLKHAKRAGKFILLASYVPHEFGKRTVLAESKKHGFITYFAERELDELRRNSGISNETYHRQSQAIRGKKHTPGSFFLNTVPRGHFKYSFGLEHFQDRSLFEERDAGGQVTFSERATFRESQFRYGMEYGVTDNLEIGLIIPTVYVELKLREIVGDGLRSRESEYGLGNITLTTDYSLTWSETHDIYSLASAELALPTSTLDEDLESQGSLRLFYTVEKFWGPVGLSLGGGFTAVGEDGFNNPEVLSAWSVGALADLFDNLFLSLNYGEEEDISVIESSLEWLLSPRTSIEMYGGIDNEDTVDFWYVGVTLNIIP